MRNNRICNYNPVAIPRHLLVKSQVDGPGRGSKGATPTARALGTCIIPSRRGLRQPRRWASSPGPTRRRRPRIGRPVVHVGRRPLESTPSPPAPAQLPAPPPDRPHVGRSLPTRHAAIRAARAADSPTRPRTPPAPPSGPRTGVKARAPPGPCPVTGKRSRPNWPVYPSTHPPRYAPLIEAADYAGVPVSTLRHYVRTGQLPAYRFGKRLLQIDLNDIDRMRRRVPTVTATKPPTTTATRKAATTKRGSPATRRRTA